MYTVEIKIITITYRSLCPVLDKRSAVQDSELNFIRNGIDLTMSIVGHTSAKSASSPNSASSANS